MPALAHPRVCAPVLVLLRLALAALLATAATAQTKCAACDGSEIVACTSCEAAGDGVVVVCTECARCRVCRGSGIAACACAADGAGLGARAADVQARLRDVRAVLDAARVREATACRTKHFDVVFAPSRIDDCPAKTPHEQLHLYARRLEELRAAALAAVGSHDDGGRCTLVLVRDDLDAARLWAHLTGTEAQGLGVVAASRRACVLRHEPKATRTDAALQRLLAHAVAHLAMRGAMAAATPGEQTLEELGYGWLDEGFAHWLEAEQPGELCETFCCLDRLQSPRRVLGSTWRVGVRALLRRSELPAVAEVLGPDAADQTPAQHALAFALVDFLLAPTHAPATPGPAGVTRALPAVLQAAQAGRTPADALQAATGLDVSRLDARLRAFVTETYPER